MIRAGATAVALAAALALNVAAGQAADECKGLQVCIPVAGPWVVIPAPAGASATATWQLVCPQGVVGRRRRQGERGKRRGRVPRTDRQPGQPGHHDDRIAALQGHLRGARPQGHELPALHRLHPGRRRRVRARRWRFSRVSADVKPGEPITLRVETLDLVPGRLARKTLTCRKGERLLRSTHSVGIYTVDVPTAAQFGSVRVVRVRRGGRILVSATRRGLDPGLRASVQVQMECAR